MATQPGLDLSKLLIAWTKGYKAAPNDHGVHGRPLSGDYGRQKYTEIKVSALAIYALPHSQPGAIHR
jgi:hypothetical protein